MRRTAIAAVAAVALGALLFAGTGCTRVRLQDRPDTRTFTETKVVELAPGRELTAEITQGVGELTLHGESSTTTYTHGTFKGDFTFTPESWRPEVGYSVEGGRGVLTVRQPRGSSVPDFGGAKNNWSLVLPSSVPTRLKLTLGVGKSMVDLNGLDIERLDIVTGVGETTIDLSDRRPQSLAGRIEAGVGDLTVKVPKDMGVRITGREAGLGHFSADGFIAQGNSWMNEAYSRPEGPKIDLELVRGVGNVTLVLVP